MKIAAQVPWPLVRVATGVEGRDSTAAPRSMLPERGYTTECYLMAKRFLVLYQSIPAAPGPLVWIRPELGVCVDQRQVWVGFFFACLRQLSNLQTLNRCEGLQRTELESLSVELKSRGLSQRERARESFLIATTRGGVIFLPRGGVEVIVQEKKKKTVRNCELCRTWGGAQVEKRVWGVCLHFEVDEIYWF